MPVPGPGESPLYRGTFDCFKQTLAKEVGDSRCMSFWFSIQCISLFTTLCSLFYSFLLSVMFSTTGVQRPVQRHGSPYHWSHAHVRCLLLWLWPGQETTTENPWRCPYVGDCSIVESLPYLFCCMVKLCAGGCMLVCVLCITIRCPAQVSTAVCCRHAVRRVHHSHHGPWRTYQVSPTGEHGTYRTERRLTRIRLTGFWITGWGQRRCVSVNRTHVIRSLAIDRKTYVTWANTVLRHEEDPGFQPSWVHYMLCVYRSRQPKGRWSMLGPWTVWSSCTKRVGLGESTEALLSPSWEVLPDWIFTECTNIRNTFLILSCTSLFAPPSYPVQRHLNILSCPFTFWMAHIHSPCLNWTRGFKIIF
jgi:hypothetical protein